MPFKMSNNTSDNGVIVATPTAVEVALEKDDLEGVVQALAQEPEAFKKFLDSTERALIESKSQAGVIKDRNFFKKLFSSNTADLAKIVLEQNDIMTRFYVILQLLSMQTKGNATYLVKICEAIKSSADVEDQEQGNLQKIAVNYLEQSIEAAKAEEVRDRALKKLLKSAERTALFEQEIREAHKKASKQYEESSESLKKEFDSYSESLKEELSSFEKEIKQAFEDQQKIIDEKATPGQIKNSVEALAKDTDKKIESQSQVLYETILGVKKRLKTQGFVMGIISVLALIAGVLALFLR